jgi:iron complex outermembrane receptor protein
MILSHQLIYAQNKISGIVTDQDNQPLPGATIFVSDMNKGTISDKYGKYMLSDLPDGKIRIVFSFIGYANQIETVELSSKKSELNAKLKQTAVEADEVVILFRIPVSKGLQ